jgi:hypothetical protein
LESAPKLLQRLSHAIDALFITILCSWLGRLLRYEETGKRCFIQSREAAPRILFDLATQLLPSLTRVRFWTEGHRTQGQVERPVVRCEQRGANLATQLIQTSTHRGGQQQVEASTTGVEQVTAWHRRSFEQRVSTGIGQELQVE